MQLARWLRWKPWTTLKEPLVWSLHLTYACIPFRAAYQSVSGIKLDSLTACLYPTICYTWSLSERLYAYLIDDFACDNGTYRANDLSDQTCGWRLQPSYLAFCARFCVAFWPRTCCWWWYRGSALIIVSSLYSSWNLAPCCLRPELRRPPRTTPGINRQTFLPLVFAYSYFNTITGLMRLLFNVEPLKFYNLLIINR